MDIVRTRPEIARWQAAHDGSLGFVPTMGNLHAGHLSLVTAAKAENRRVAVSIFVNPTQFGPHEDLAAYPRTLDADLAKLEAAGCDLVCVPDVTTIYPPGFATLVEPGPVADPLCGQFRPGHFRGVATVVSTFFHLMQPTHAYFGGKDWQQCLVVRRLVLDLAFPLTLVISPTVREDDGLAMSSRNGFLAPEERREAAILAQALQAGRAVYDGGSRDPAAVAAAARQHLAADRNLEAASGFRIQYLDCLDAETLAPLPVGFARPAVLAVAAHLGSTRLIDNLLLGNTAFLTRTPGLG